MNLLGIFKNFHLFLLKNKNMYNNGDILYTFLIEVVWK